MDRAAATATEAVAAANVRAARQAPTRATVGFPPGHRLTNGDLLNGREDRPKATGGSFIQDSRTHTRQRIRKRLLTQTRVRRISRAPLRGRRRRRRGERGRTHAVTSTNDDILLCRRARYGCPITATATVRSRTHRGGISHH